MKRTENMVSYTNSKKDETIEKVQNAIDTLKDEGREVTRKEITEITGLSNSVLSKPHVKEIFEKNKVVMYARKRITKEELPNKVGVLKKENAVFQRKIKQQENIIHNNEIAIEYLKYKELKLKDEYDKLNKDYERLLGKFQKLLEKVERIGLDIDELGLY